MIWLSIMFVGAIEDLREPFGIFQFFWKCVLEMTAVLACIVYASDFSAWLHRWKEKIANIPLALPLFMIVFIVGRLMFGLVLSSLRGELESLRSDPLQSRRQKARAAGSASKNDAKRSGSIKKGRGRQNV